MHLERLDRFERVRAASQSLLDRRDRQSRHRLALPVVENWIRQRLSKGDFQAQGWIVDRDAWREFSCCGGNAQVFCTHGNEVDDWNVVDHEQLQRARQRDQRGRAVDRYRWEPNSGTRLVVDVMNYVKTSYPFVDLLKPETAALASVLLRHRSRYLQANRYRTCLSGSEGQDQRRTGRSECYRARRRPRSTRRPPRATARAVEQLLGPSLREAVRHSGRLNRSSEDDLLRRAGSTPGAVQKVPAQQVRPRSTRWAPVRWSAPHGSCSQAGSAPYRQSKRHAVALEDWLFDDKTYDVNAATDDGGVYERMQDPSEDQVDFVITGHAHLPRALLRLRRGSGYYYNSGTWIRTLRLTPRRSTQGVQGACMAGAHRQKMSALDEAMIPGKGGKDQRLVWDRTNAARAARPEGPGRVGRRSAARSRRAEPGDGEIGSRRTYPILRSRCPAPMCTLPYRQARADSSWPGAQSAPFPADAVYIALCGNESPVTFHIELEHYKLLTGLARLRYGSADDAATPSFRIQVKKTAYGKSAKRSRASSPTSRLCSPRYPRTRRSESTDRRLRLGPRPPESRARGLRARI